MGALGDRSIRDSLPLPVARLWRRALNAKSAKDRHDTAYFAWEVSIRLGVAVAPPADVTSLARGSTGTWASALQGADRILEESSLIEGHSAWVEVVTGRPGSRRSVRLGDLASTLAAYRNKIIGHGSVRADTFYAEHGPRLLAALEVAWRAALFLPDGSRLAFVESVELTSTGDKKARVLDVSGDAPVVVDPNGVYLPDGILPGRLYVRGPTGWSGLHPWLLFDCVEERMWCFNGLGRRAEYLDYASGETLPTDELRRAFPGTEEALRAILGSGARTGEGASTPIPDARRFGEYEVLGKLGQGGMGAVYLARQQSLDRLVALKMLPDDRAKDPIAVARFRREIRALARCDHPNVIKILASGETRGTHYYAMEYVDGVDLARVIRAMPASLDFETAISSACEAARGERGELFPDLPPIPRRTNLPLRGDERYRQVARFFAQAADGLHHLHDQGIVHRDISPANIMVTWPEERAVVMDLGLAALEDASVSLTRDKSQIIGTLRYLAPEQLQRRVDQVDRRADLYALGATAYEVLTGRPIFDGDTEARLIQQVLHERPRSLLGIAPEVDPLLAHVFEHAIEKQPTARYGTARDLADDLRTWLAGGTPTARPPGAYLKARSAILEHRSYLLLAGAACVGAAACLALVRVIEAPTRETGGPLASEVARRGGHARELQNRVLEHLLGLEHAIPDGREQIHSWLDSATAFADSRQYMSLRDACRNDLARFVIPPTDRTEQAAAEVAHAGWNNVTERLRKLKSALEAYAPRPQPSGAAPVEAVDLPPAPRAQSTSSKSESGSQRDLAGVEANDLLGSDPRGLRDLADRLQALPRIDRDALTAGLRSTVAECGLDPLVQLSAWVSFLEGCAQETWAPGLGARLWLETSETQRFLELLVRELGLDRLRATNEPEDLLSQDEAQRSLGLALVVLDKGGPTIGRARLLAALRPRLAPDER